MDYILCLWTYHRKWSGNQVFLGRQENIFIFLVKCPVYTNLRELLLGSVSLHEACLSSKSPSIINFIHQVWIQQLLNSKVATQTVVFSFVMLSESGKLLLLFHRYFIYLPVYPISQIWYSCLYFQCCLISQWPTISNLFLYFFCFLITDIFFYIFVDLLLLY